MMNKAFCHFMISKNSLSKIILTPNAFACLYFEPGFSPTTRKSAFLLIELRILPPNSFILSFALSLEIDFSSPVKTKDLPDNLLDFVLDY